jgi:hypothetical protein
VKLVGDRYQLEQRQRIAVARCACSEAARERRRRTRVAPAAAAGGTLLVDGYNLLTSVEAALARGVILAARDGCYRDMASVHGTWRRVAETAPALELVGLFLEHAGIMRTIWYLDRPVSNSGRLKTIITNLAAGRGWNWQVELVPDPDRVLAVAIDVVATADSAILDRCPRWLNLAAELIHAKCPTAWLVDLSPPGEPGA